MTKANISRKTEVPIDIDTIENILYPGSKFIGDFCIKDQNGNWVNEPVAVFYQPNPPEKSPMGRPCSNYFGIYIALDGRGMICDAKSAFDEDTVGFIDSGGYFIYSRFRHDYRTSKDGRLFIDGAKDYIRTNCSDQLKSARINGDHLEYD